MGRSSGKRKSDRSPKSAVASSSPSSSVAPDSRSSKSKSRTKGYVAIDGLFDQYVNNSLDMIDPEGVVQLCSDLQVEHTDVRLLMLAWKMGAQKQGYFTRDEWRSGLKALGVDSIDSLKSSLPQLEKEVSQEENFEEFYSYAFQYCLTEERQKYIDIESTCELLNIVLGPRFDTKINSLIEYLKIQSDYKGINADQWMNFLRFCKEISFPDVENYDPGQAWPLILDNFVDWMKDKKL